MATPRLTTLKSRFPEIIAEMRPRLSAATKEGAEIIAKEMAERAPRSRGVGRGRGDMENEHLADHIEVKRSGAGKYKVGPPQEFFYAGFIEYGTTYDPPQPFMVPAAEAKNEEVEAKMRAALEEL